MDKPTIVHLDPTDLRNSAHSPELHALLEKGWTVMTTVITEEGKPPEVRQRITLVMAPPGGPNALGAYGYRWLWQAFTTGLVTAIALALLLAGWGWAAPG